jgi:uncharacterized membrane protein
VCVRILASFLFSSLIAFLTGSFGKTGKVLLAVGPFEFFG